jgi:hypothetical protein
MELTTSVQCARHRGPHDRAVQKNNGDQRVSLLDVVSRGDYKDADLVVTVLSGLQSSPFLTSPEEDPSS